MSGMLLNRTTISVNDICRLFTPTYLVVETLPRQFRGDRLRHVRESQAQALFTQFDLGPVAPPVVRVELGQLAAPGHDMAAI
jgi:hypothetical protein